MSKEIQEVLETLTAEAFIFGNLSLGKGVDKPLPDDDHELPPVEKAMQAISVIIAKSQYKELTDLAKYKNGSHKAWCDHYEERYKYLKSKISRGEG